MKANSAWIVFALLVGGLLLSGCSGGAGSDQNAALAPSPTPMPGAEAKDCNELEQEIRLLLDEANYCEEDSDCGYRSFECPFDCYPAVNKDADFNEINAAVLEFVADCELCEQTCSAVESS